MKIKYAIMSSDSNPLYLDFWPVISKIWYEKFNITPVLYYFGDNVDSIDTQYGIVKHMTPAPDVPIYFQCLWVRYWSYAEHLDDISIISDIDMIPLSTKYFIDSIADVADDMYVHLNACILSYGTLPSCYHVCRGDIYKDILSLDDDYIADVTRVFNMNLGEDPGAHLTGNQQWYADERYASSKVLEYYNNNPEKVLLFDRSSKTGDRRIDRSNWSYDVEGLKSGFYLDSHSIRPYSKYKDEIDKIVNIIC